MIDEWRLLNAYTFLSFDSIELYASELWLDFIDINEYRRIIRNELTPHLKSDTGYYENGLLITSILNNYLKSRNSNEFYRLLWWIRNIFIFDGSDRLSELIWETISVRLSKKNLTRVKCDTQLFKKIINLGKICINSSDQIEKKMEESKLKFKTNYNIQIVNTLDIENDSIETRIMLIANHNFFINIWENEFKNISNDDLIKLYDLGKDMIKDIMPGVDIKFPGCWKNEIDEYYFSKE